ncbi:hypothetical protein GGER_52020 [Serratia rubidaea]
MIALIQRVLNASVTVNGETVGKIGPGLLVLLGVEQDDNEQKAERLCERVLGYRIFGDDNGKMNLNVQQAGGSVLVVSQFTLAADTQKVCGPASRAARSLRRPIGYISILLANAANAVWKHRPASSRRICKSHW